MADNKSDRDDRDPSDVPGPWAERWRASRVNRTLLLLLVVFQLADIVSTNYGLALPGVLEGNPLMALSQAKLGAAWWLPKLIAIAVVAAAAPFSRRRWPMVAMVSISGLTVLINFAHL